MRDKIIKIFESSVITNQPLLKKTELDQNQFVRVLVSKPGDINIILARTSSLITGDTPEKTKQMLINEILEVLERSEASRIFVGLGLQESYHVYKGFPVRKGEKFSDLPEQGSEIQLDTPALYQSWTVDPTNGRQIATMFDPAKGDPVGGLLVDSHIDNKKIIFDVNAVIRTCKKYYKIIANYNLKAPQGKSISNKNVDFLATETQYYHDIYELLTDPSIVSVKVTDTWKWNVSGGRKVPQWKTSADTQQKPPVTGDTQ